MDASGWHLLNQGCHLAVMLFTSFLFDIFKNAWVLIARRGTPTIDRTLSLSQEVILFSKFHALLSLRIAPSVTDRSCLWYCWLISKIVINFHTSIFFFKEVWSNFRKCSMTLFTFQNLIMIYYFRLILTHRKFITRDFTLISIFEIFKLFELVTTFHLVIIKIILIIQTIAHMKLTFPLHLIWEISRLIRCMLVCYLGLCHLI